MNKYGNSKVKSGLIGAVIVLALGGTGVFAINTGDGVQNANVAQAKKGSDDISHMDDDKYSKMLSTNEVKNLKIVKSAGSSVTEVELEEEHGEWFYKVKHADGKEHFYDAYSGKTKHKTDRMMHDDYYATPMKKDTTSRSINSSRAAQIAKDHNGGGTIRKIERETEHGAAIYSVRFTDDARVDVRAYDGAIVRVEPGDDDKKYDRGDKRDDKKDDREYKKYDDSGRSGYDNQLIYCNWLNACDKLFVARFLFGEITHSPYDTALVY